MQHRSEETRARILTAAQQQFARSGYDAASVADICQAAGVSKGAFYHHFASKQAIFNALLENWLAVMDAQLELIHSKKSPVPQTLIQMTEVAPLIFEVARGQLPMFLEFWTQASHDAAVWKTTIAPYHRYQEFFAALIREGIAEESLNPVDEAVAARAIVSIVVGLLLQGILDPQGADWGQVTQQSMELLLDGLARRPG